MIQRRFNKLFFIGLYFFLAANIWHWVTRHSNSLSDGWTDGIHGLLIGLAIGCMLFSMARGRSSCRRDAA
jgi:uncharacterized membrane protein